LREEAPPRG